MLAGRLDKQITIQKFVAERNTHGEETQTWVKLCTVWTQVISERGRERFISAKENAEDNLVFKIRYRTDVLRSYRILYQNEVYDIKSITEIGRRDGLEIFAEAIRV